MRPLLSILTLSLLAMGQDDAPSPPISVVAIPSTVESVLTFDLRQEEDFPWLSWFRERANRAAESVLPDAVSRALLGGGVDRYTRGGRRFAAGPESPGDREQITIFETARPLAGLIAALEKAEGMEARDFPHGRLFRQQIEGGERWLGVGGEKAFVISMERALVEETLARVSGAELRPVFEVFFEGTSWEKPGLLFRIYDRNNPRDARSPVNEPRDDRPPQSRPFKVLGIRVSIDGEAMPAAILDVKTDEVEKARLYYRELLEPDRPMKKHPSPGEGWMRLGFDADPKKERRLWGRILLLYGAQP